MAASYLTDWNPIIIVATNQAIVNALDGGSSNAYVTIHSSSDTLLATVTLTDPCGTVNGTTGIATLTPTGPDTHAANTGTASYASLRRSDGTVMRSLGCQEGSVPVDGACVLSSLTIAAGATVTINSITLT